jgi:hypothetical protein
VEDILSFHLDCMKSRPHPRCNALLFLPDGVGVDGRRLHLRMPRIPIFYPFLESSEFLKFSRFVRG